MADQLPPEPSELIYTPGYSWAPACFAFGLAGVLAGIIVWFPYGVAGGIIALVALVAMLRAASRQADRLPRKQRPTTAVLPPDSQRVEPASR
mgnify:CR=1|jgi:hypothetical protein